MDDVRFDFVLDAADRQNRRDCRKWRQASAAKRDRVQDEAFLRDGLCALVDVGRDMNLEAGRARRARHRQAVEQKGEILVDDVEHPPR